MVLFIMITQAEIFIGLYEILASLSCDNCWAQRELWLSLLNLFRFFPESWGFQQNAQNCIVVLRVKVSEETTFLF